MGHVLLGCLAAVSLLVNVLLMRLRRGLRPEAVTRFAAAFLRWLPLAAVAMVAGGVALGEMSLLNYYDGQAVNGLDGFLVGAGLSIFADLCAAMTWIMLREAVKVTGAADDLEKALAVLAAQDFPGVGEQDEP